MSPPNLVTVPAEPTEDMLVNGQEAWAKARVARPAIEDCKEAEAVYRAMIAVAPAAPPQVPVAWAIELPDGTISRLGWQDAGTLDTMLRIAKLHDGARIVYAYRGASLPAELTEVERAALQEALMKAGTWEQRDTIDILVVCAYCLADGRPADISSGAWKKSSQKPGRHVCPRCVHREAGRDGDLRRAENSQ